MNSLVAQQQGYTFPMDEIPRTYYPGRGFLSEQEAYPENPFYRPPTYGGGMNVPGAPGNLGGYAGLPEVINKIEQQQQEFERKKFEYDMNPNNQPQPYNPGTNHVFPDYPFGRPTGTGGWATLPYYGGPTNPIKMPYYPGQDYGGVQLFTADPSYAIPGGQTPYRRGPYLPFEDIPEDNAPFIPIPRAQGLPMGFQNKFVS